MTNLKSLVPGATEIATWPLFNALTASPFGFPFHLAVTAPVITMVATWALAMGVVGGVLPAVRAARVSVMTALRAA